MSGTTSTQAIPYPTSTDKVSDYPALSKAAAEKIDTLLTAVAVDATTVPFVAGWQAGLLTLTKIGKVVHCDGYIKRDSTAIASGTTTNIGVVPAEFRPDPSVYSSTGSYAATAATFVNGSSVPYRGDALIQLALDNGNVTVTTERTATDVRVSCHWITA